MCRRMIINAGIKNVVCRISETDYADIPVEEWIVGDDTLQP
jgi:dCMP deaminase